MKIAIVVKRVCAAVGALISPFLITAGWHWATSGSDIIVPVVSLFIGAWLLKIALDLRSPIFIALAWTVYFLVFGWLVIGFAYMFVGSVFGRWL